MPIKVALDYAFKFFIGCSTFEVILNQSKRRLLCHSSLSFVTFVFFFSYMFLPTSICHSRVQLICTAFCSVLFENQQEAFNYR